MTADDDARRIYVNSARQVLAEIETGDHFEDERDAYRLLGMAKAALAGLLDVIDGGAS